MYVTKASLSQIGAPTYRAFGAAYTGYATPTDMLRISGSDTKIVVVTSFGMQVNTTSAALQAIDFVRRTAANTGGTPSALTAIKLDTNEGDATAVVETYAAAPSALGAGTIISRQTANSGAATAAPAFLNLYSVISLPDFQTMRKPIVLRGSAQGLCFNYAGAALTAGFTAVPVIEWVEID